MKKTGAKHSGAAKAGAMKIDLQMGDHLRADAFHLPGAGTAATWAKCHGRIEGAGGRTSFCSMRRGRARGQ